MLISPVTAGPVSLPTGSISATPEPPARWSRFWTSPIARVDYGAGSRVPLWGEATIPADRGITGQLLRGLSLGGSTRVAVFVEGGLVWRLLV